MACQTLDAALITPRQDHLALNKAIVALANASGQDRLMVRSDGGAETHRYYREATLSRLLTQQPKEPGF